MLPSRRRGCKSWHCSRTASASAPHTPQQLPGGNGKCGKSILSLKSANYLLVLLLQLPKSLLLHLLSSVWPGNVKIKGQFNKTQRLIKMVRSRVNSPKYEGFSKWSTYKRRKACCPASYFSPSCSSRPSRQGWPSSCHFSPGLSGVAHFYSKKQISDDSTAPAY